jgi:hypothetical protein
MISGIMAYLNPKREPCDQVARASGFCAYSTFGVGIFLGSIFFGAGIGSPLGKGIGALGVALGGAYSGGTGYFGTMPGAVGATIPGAVGATIPGAGAQGAGTVWQGGGGHGGPQSARRTPRLPRR